MIECRKDDRISVCKENFHKIINLLNRYGYPGRCLCNYEKESIILLGMHNGNDTAYEYYKGEKITISKNRAVKAGKYNNYKAFNLGYDSSEIYRLNRNKNVSFFTITNGTSPMIYIRDKCGNDYKYPIKACILVFDEDDVFVEAMEHWNLTIKGTLEKHGYRIIEADEYLGGI